MIRTVTAINADSAGNSPDRGKTAKEPEEGAKGAHVPAPVPLFEPFKKEDGQEDDDGQECEGVKGLPEGQYVVTQKIVQKGDMVPPVTRHIVEASPAGSGQIAEKRVEKEREGPYQDCNGVKYAGYIDGEEGCGKEGEKQVIFQGSPEKTNGLALRYLLRYEVDHRTQRADPAAEEPTQNEGG